MMKGKPHPVLAGIADFYSAAMVTGAVVALVMAATNATVPVLAGLAWMAVLIVVVIIYHRRVATKVAWRSPGESMMGRYVALDGEKSWTNPYGRNRAVLFTLFFISLGIAGNTWDDMMYTSSIGVVGIFRKSLWIGVLLTGLVLLGRGKSWGGLLVALYYASFAVGALLKPEPETIDPAVVQALGYGFVCLAGFAVLVTAWYEGYRREDQSTRTSSD